MKAHPLADEYNFISKEEMDDLVESIRKEGLLDPIVTIEHEGETVILDGRNRYAACERAEVKPKFITFEKRTAGTNMTPWRYVFLKNVLRRHLTTTQRAFLAVKAKDRYQEATKADPTMLDRYRTKAEPRPTWVDVAAGDLKVSPATIDRATQVSRTAETGVAPDGRELEPKKLDKLRELVEQATHGAGGEADKADGTKGVTVNGLKTRFLDPPTEKAAKPSAESIARDVVVALRKALKPYQGSKVPTRLVADLRALRNDIDLLLGEGE